MSKVMILKTGLVKKFEIEEIVGGNVDIEYLQNKVSGHIEIPNISKKLNGRLIDVVVNRDGMLMGLEPTIVILDNSEKIIGALLGTIVFCSHDEKGNKVGLNDLQVKFIENFFADNIDMYSGDDDKTFTVKSIVLDI